MTVLLEPTPSPEGKVKDRAPQWAPLRLGRCFRSMNRTPQVPHCPSDLCPHADVMSSTPSFLATGLIVTCLRGLFFLSMP